MSLNGRISEQSLLERHKKGRLRRFWDLNAEFAVTFVQRLTNDLVREILSSIVIGAINENHEEELAVYRIKEDLKKRKVVASIPMEILHGLLTDVVRELTETVARRELRKEVKLQGDILNCEIIINDQVECELQSMVGQLFNELNLESVYEDLVNDVQLTCLTGIIEDSVRGAKESERTKLINKFDKTHGHLLVDQLSYRLLLNQMQSITDPFASSPIVHQPFYEMVMDVLLNQYLLIDDNARATLHNDPIARLHKNLFIDSLLDVLLPELCAHLDEDMEDLNEYELSFL